MKTLGIVFLVLLALFFGGCAVSAVVTSQIAGPVMFIVALIAALLSAACIAGIRRLSRSSGSVPPDTTPADEDDRLR